MRDVEVRNNSVHLCDSCYNCYPECDASDGILFGDGVGRDNICCCNKYVPLAERATLTVAVQGDSTRGLYDYER